MNLLEDVLLSKVGALNKIEKKNGNFELVMIISFFFLKKKAVILQSPQNKFSYNYIMNITHMRIILQLHTPLTQPTMGHLVMPDPNP